MATQAQIKINGVVGSNDDLPLNTLVNLSNNGAGDETTWEWTLLSQPVGLQVNFVDSGSLVSTIAAPQINPIKEGSYLLRLVVNKGLPDEKSNQVIAAVRELQTGNRIPAALETLENNTASGWGYTAVGDILQRVTRQVDTGTFTCIAGENLVPGDVVHVSSMVQIAAGLPGERYIPQVNKALASDLAKVDGPLGIMAGQRDGAFLGVSTGEYCRVMVLGAFSQISLAGGPGVAGDPVYVDDLGEMSLTPGTNIRQVGDVAAVYAGPVYDVTVAAVSNSIPRGNAGGDLAGYYPDPTVAKVNGTSVTPAGGGAAGSVLRMTGPATADWGQVDLSDPDAITGNLPATNISGVLAVANGGTGISTTPAAGVVPYGDGAQYSLLTPGTADQILRSGTTPSWGTVPSAAFADDSIPYSAMQDIRITQNTNGTYTNATTSFSQAGTVSLTLSAGNANITVSPQSDGSQFDAWLTTATNNGSATAEIRYTITGPVGFTTQIFLQKHRSATSNNSNQVTGAVWFPPIGFTASVAGSYTVLMETRVLTAGDSISLSNYRLRLSQG